MILFNELLKNKKEIEFIHRHHLVGIAALRLNLSP